MTSTRAPRAPKIAEDLARVICEEYLNTSASTRDLAKKYKTSPHRIGQCLRAEGVNAASLKNAKISASRKGFPSPRKGCKLTDVSKLKISESRKGIATTSGYKFTEAQKENMRKAARLRLARDPDYPVRALAHVRKCNPEVSKEKAKCRSRYKSLINRLFRRSGTKKEDSSCDILGFTSAEFKAHLESQFRPGMTWHDRESFHIDHIIPVNAFLVNGVTDPKIINALVNLQPLFPHENRAKSDNYNMSNFDEDVRKIRRHLGLTLE